MLEDAALALSTKSEAELIILGWILVLAGYLAGLLFRRGSKRSLDRAPYLLAFATLYVIGSASPALGLLGLEAISRGVLWLLVVGMFGGAAAIGFACALVAHARSVSAFGHGKWAWIGFVPLANFVLFFKRPLGWVKTGPGWPRSEIFLVTFSLILFLFSIGIARKVGAELEAMVSSVEADPAIQERSIDLALRSFGLEEFLRMTAAEVKKLRIDSATTLVGGEADGTTLRFVYDVSDEAFDMPAHLRSALLDNACAEEATRKLVNAGATIAYVYRHEGGKTIATIRVTQDSCGT